MSAEQKDTLAKLRRLAEAATPGFQRAQGDSDGRPVVVAGNSRGVAYTWLVADAEYIAGARPEVVLKLLDVVEAAKEMREVAGVRCCPALERFDAALAAIEGERGGGA